MFPKDESDEEAHYDGATYMQKTIKYFLKKRWNRK